PSSASADARQSSPSMAADLLGRVNGLRQSKGLAPLASDGQLNQVALNWSTSMANSSQLSHNPNLRSQAPSGWTKLGENVGVGQSVDQLYRAFAASSGHYANMVDGAFTRTGVAVVIDESNQLWATQDFAAIGAAQAVRRV